MKPTFVIYFEFIKGYILLPFRKKGGIWSFVPQKVKKYGLLTWSVFRTHLIKY